MWRSSALLLLAPCLAFGAVTDAGDSYDGAFSDTSATPAEYGSAAENDLVIAFCTTVSEDGAWTDPADFTQINAGAAADAGIAVHHYIGYKVRGADAGSGYAFSYSGSAAGIGCTLQALRGIDTGGPFDVTYSSHLNENNNDAAATAAPSITTNTDGAWVCLFHWNWDGNITTGMPSGYTEVSFNEASNRTHVVACKEVGSAGAETPAAWGHTDVNASADSINYTLAIKPASAGGGSALLLRRRR